jgi:hypothetical protein
VPDGASDASTPSTSPGGEPGWHIIPSSIFDEVFHVCHQLGIGE